MPRINTGAEHVLPTILDGPSIEPIYELPTNEARYELQATERAQEMPAIEYPKPPTFWMADEDWAGAEPRSPGTIYLSLKCGDVLQVLEMPTHHSSHGMWRVVRRSDGTEGWVPSRYLRPLEGRLASSATARFVTSFAC